VEAIVITARGGAATVGVKETLAGKAPPTRLRFFGSGGGTDAFVCQFGERRLYSTALLGAPRAAPPAPLVDEFSWSSPRSHRAAPKSFDNRAFPSWCGRRAVDETQPAGRAAEDCVRRPGALKALAVPRAADEVVLGADTTVVIGWRNVASPPATPRPAAFGPAFRPAPRSGHRHLAARTRRDDLRIGPPLASGSPHDRPRIDDYVSSGEPMDKAAPRIQGLASKFIRENRRLYFNVVGLPAALVYRRLLEWKADYDGRSSYFDGTQSTWTGIWGVYWNSECAGPTNWSEQAIQNEHAITQEDASRRGVAPLLGMVVTPGLLRAQPPALCGRCAADAGVFDKARRRSG